VQSAEYSALSTQHLILTMPESEDIQHRMQHVEGLIRKIENLPDADARTISLELVQALMEFHGAGLERMMEMIAEAGEPGYGVFDKFAADDLVGNLLLLYGLHPLTIEARVTRALEKVRPYLNSHGGSVELLGVDDGVVRLRLEGSCKTCPSSSVTLKLAVEEAIYEKAPDVVAIEAEGVSEKPAASGFVQIGKPRSGNGDQPAAHGTHNGGGWQDVSDLATLSEKSLQTKELQGRSILFCKLGESLYAYGNECPGCGQPLQRAFIQLTSLVCNSCGQRYDLIRAGRGLDQPNLHLEPFPLLFEHGRARVALPPVATN